MPNASDPPDANLDLPYDNHLLREMVVYVTPDMYRQLMTIRARRGSKVKMSALHREALRNLIDKEDDEVGSRAHFGKTLQTRLNAMEEKLRQDIPATLQESLQPLLEQLAERDDLIQFLVETLITLEVNGWSRLLSTIQKSDENADPAKVLATALQETQKNRRRLEAKTKIVRERIPID